MRILLIVLITYVYIKFGPPRAEECLTEKAVYVYHDLLLVSMMYLACSADTPV